MACTVTPTASAAAAGVPPSSLMASDLSMPLLKHASDHLASMFLSPPDTLSGMDFQERLASAMTKRTVTPQQLADHLGVTYTAVKAAVDGSTKAMTAANTARTARYLNVDHYWLATGEGQMIQDGEDDKMALTPDERDLIVALRVLLPSDREEFIGKIIERARERVGELDAVLARVRPGANVLKLHKP